MAVEPIRVLHVDDDPALADLFATYIERDNEDIIVETETDPQQCLEQIGTTHNGVDCVVCDYDMPGLNGLEVLETVRNHHPSLPFILYTGKGSEEIAAEAISKGVDEYMQKETGTDQYAVLANRIKHIVDQYRLERALRNSEARYRALVEQNIVGIYLIEADYEFTYVNPRFAEIFGYAQEELIGKPAGYVVADIDGAQVRENLRKRFEGELETIQYRFTGKHKTGDTLDILVQGTRVERNGAFAVTGVLLDLDDLDLDEQGDS